MYQFAVFRTKEGGVIQHFCLKYTCGGMIFKTLLHSINIKVYFNVHIMLCIFICMYNKRFAK